jgi:hypothetical protein
MNERIDITLLRVEAVRLAELAEDLRELLRSRDGQDEAIVRLAPNPYPDDPDAAAQFAETTSAELLDRRSADAAAVVSTLAPLLVGSDDLSEGQAFTEHRISVTTSDVEAWLRAINAMRLVLATRLGIADDDTHDPGDPRYGVYDWLGYRLELLIEAADEAE